MYETVKQLTGQCHKKPAAVKSKDGKLLKRKEERLNMWKEHFQELLNREQPLEPPQNEENEREKKPSDYSRSAYKTGNQEGNPVYANWQGPRDRPSYSRDD